MIPSIAVRCIAVAAAVNLAFYQTGLFAAPSEGAALVPICSYGKTILIPFPGEEDAPIERRAACHATCAGERPRLGRSDSKKR